MKSFHTLRLFLTVILNSVELSLHFDCLPNGEPIPYASSVNSSSSNSPAKSPPRTEHHNSFHARYVSAPDKHQSSLRVQARTPPTEPRISSRVRSRTPPARNSPPRILGYTYEELRFVRFVPITNQDRSFEIRRYTFPRDKLIYMKGEHKTILPMPMDEQDVLSTSNGDILAIVENSAVRKILRGIYAKTANNTYSRSKINADSGKVQLMSQEEIRETPLGTRCAISKVFRTVNIQDLHPPQ